MKHRWVIVCLVALLCAGAVAVVKYRHSIWGDVMVSETYSHYVDNTDVEATFVRDFRVNDSVTVDVTLLKAKNDKMWMELKSRFCNINIDEVPEQYRDLVLNGDGICVNKYPANRPDLPVTDTTTADIELAVADNRQHTVYVFHADTQESASMIFRNRFEKYFENI